MGIAGAGLLSWGVCCAASAALLPEAAAIGLVLAATPLPACCTVLGWGACRKEESSFFCGCLKMSESMNSRSSPSARPQAIRQHPVRRARS